MGEFIRGYDLNWTYTADIDRDVVHNHPEFLHEHVATLFFDYTKKIPKTLIVTRSSQTQNVSKDKADTKLETICDNAGLMDNKVAGHGKAQFPHQDVLRENYEEIGILEANTIFMGYQGLLLAVHPSKMENFKKDYDGKVIFSEFVRLNYVTTRIGKNKNISHEPIILNVHVAIVGPNCAITPNGGLIAIAKSESVDPILELEKAEWVDVPEYLLDIVKHPDKYTMDARETTPAIESAYRQGLLDFDTSDVLKKLRKMSENSFRNTGVGESLMRPPHNFSPISRMTIQFHHHENGN
jgi:hypothetical protein